MDNAQQRPTAWIIATAVLALIAIGLGIWAFSTKSDLDDANATIDEQKQQLASQRSVAASSEQRLRAFGARERAALRRVTRRFVGEETDAATLQRSVHKEAGELDSARSDAASAQTQEKKDSAALNEAKQRSDLASACVKGAVSALDRFFNATSARAGANAAVRELEAIQGDCKKADS